MAPRGSIPAVSVLSLIALLGSSQLAFTDVRAYVTNIGSPLSGQAVLNVSVINTSTNTVVETIGAGDSPDGVAITPDGARAYVANSQSSSVSVIDTSSNSVVATVRVGNAPVAVAITPDGTRVYVANSNSSSVSVIDAASNTVIATVPLENNARGVAITPDGTRAYVTVVGSSVITNGSVSVIDTSNNTVVATVGVGLVPAGIAVTPDGTRAYVTNSGGNAVSVIDTSSNTVATKVTGLNLPAGVAITPDGTRAYVTDTGGISVSVVDISSNTVIAKVQVGKGPWGVAITPDGTRAYVANEQGKTVSVIDTRAADKEYNTVVATVDVGINPIGVAVAEIPTGNKTPVVPPNGVINNAGFNHAVGGGLTVSPGLIAAIFGTNLSTAPATGIKLGFQPGTTSLYTTFMGTSVTFDGTPAPLYSLSPVQVDVQVPFQVAGKASTQVVVTLNGKASAPVTVPLLAATPGIVTVNSSGAGAAVVLNQDGTTNTAANPAVRGDVIQIYATGLGPVSPAAITGQAAPSSPLSKCVDAPTVTIDRVPSPFQFCGLAPTFVGLWQVNVSVPTGIATGAVPLLLTIGGVDSNAVTVFLK